jgi:hypothetical protein
MKHRTVGFLLATAIASAQTPQSFEVVSIKPSNSADRRPLFKYEPGGRFTSLNVPVKQLI